MIPIVAGCVTLILGSGLAFILMKKKEADDAKHAAAEEEVVEELDTDVS